MQRLQADPGTLALEVVSTQLDLLKGAPEIEVSAFGFSFSFKTSKVDERGENAWTWVGQREDGYAVLVVQDDQISGTVFSRDLTFSVLPLETGYATLRLVDPADALAEYGPLEDELQLSGEWAPAPVVEDGLVYTVAVFYTNAASGYVTGTLSQSIGLHAQQAVSESNVVYLNSLIGSGGKPMRAELVGAFVTNYSELHTDPSICDPNPTPCNNTAVDLDRFATKTEGFMDEVHVIRDKLGADVVILMSRVNDTGGLATLNASAPSAFGQVRVQQGTGASYTFGHEIGHIQGAAHNAEQNALDSSTPAYPYGQGYGGPGPNPAGRTWKTVMSYASSACSPNCTETAPYFSNPGVSYGGSPTGDPTTADNARVLNERMQTVANFRHGSGALAVAPGGIRVAANEDVPRFGHAVAGTSGYTQTVTLTNTSASAYAITGVSPSTDDFTVLDFTEGPLAPGASMTFLLRFNPTAIGLLSAVISISHTSGDMASPFRFNAIGRGAEAAAGINPSSPILLPGHNGVTAGLLSSTLDSTVPGTINDLRVNVDLDPLTVFWSSLILKHPDGTAIDLYQLGTAGPNPGWWTRLEQTQFADTGATAFTAGTSPYSAVFRPAEPLSGVNGKAKSGTWTLEVRSYVIGGSSSGLYGWSLQFGESTSEPGLSPAFAVDVSSSLPIIVERAEYTDSTVNGELIYNSRGSNTTGTVDPALSWYFPDINTIDYDVYLVVVNDSVSMATVTMKYVSGGTLVKQEVYEIPAGQPKKLLVNAIPGLNLADLSAIITSNVPVIVEKSVNWSGHMQGAPVAVMGGAGTTGASAASTEWYLAEGSTAGWKLWFTIMNPSSTLSSSVTLEYLLEGQPPVTQQFTLVPFSKRRIYVNEILPFSNVSLRTTASRPVVVERMMHWNANPAGQEIERIGGHNSMAVRSPQRTWYLAEGSTAGWHLWVLLMNPQSTTTQATVTWLREDGAPIEELYSLPPNSRKTIEARRIPGLESANISVRVESSAPILVERAMYWDTQMSFGKIFNTDGHNSLGVNTLATHWRTTATSKDYRTWVLFLNPNTQPAEVVMKLTSDTGQVITNNYTVPGNSRKSVQLNFLW